MLLIAGFALLRAVGTATSTLDRHRALAAAERETLAKLPRGRPPVLAPARPGNAATVLEDFVGALCKLPEGDRERIERKTDEVPASAFAVVDAHPEVLAALEPILFVASDPPALGPADRGVDVGRFQPAWGWLDVAAVRREGEGGASRALHVALLAETVATEIAHLGTPLHRLIGTLIEGIALRRARLAIQAGDVTVGDARDVGRALDALDRARLPVATTLAVERYLTRVALCDAAGDPNSGFAVQRGIEWGRLLSGAGLRRLLPGKVRYAHALERWDAAVDRMGAAFSRHAADARGAIADVEAAARDDDEIVAACLQVWPKHVRAAAGARARLLVLRAALAVAEATATRGTPPAALADLVPDVLPAVPLDPWDGRPLRFDGKRVWSVGPDGRDDGGTTPDADGDQGDVVCAVPRAR